MSTLRARWCGECKGGNIKVWGECFSKKVAAWLCTRSPEGAMQRCGTLTRLWVT